MKYQCNWVTSNSYQKKGLLLHFYAVVEIWESATRAMKHSENITQILAYTLFWNRELTDEEIKWARFFHDRVQIRQSYIKIDTQESKKKYS